MTDEEYDGVQLQVLANQLVTFYIVRHLFLKIVAMQSAILKIKEGFELGNTKIQILGKEGDSVKAHFYKSRERNFM
jgi:hypothetical protein